MDIQLMLSVAMFATVTSGTPGPNNVMLTASGANFGYWRTLPHMFGIVLGILVMNILVAAGLGVIFEQYPMVQQVLKIDDEIVPGIPQLAQKPAHPAQRFQESPAAKISQPGLSRTHENTVQRAVSSDDVRRSLLYEPRDVGIRVVRSQSV